MLSCAPIQKLQQTLNTICITFQISSEILGLADETYHEENKPNQMKLTSYTQELNSIDLENKPYLINRQAKGQFSNNITKGHRDFEVVIVQNAKSGLSLNRGFLQSQSKPKNRLYLLQLCTQLIVQKVMIQNGKPK